MAKRWGILVAALAFGACAPAAETDTEREADATATADGPVAAASGSTATPADTVYVDVRSREEFAGGHVQGAINIPHTELRARHPELEEYADDQIVLYCRSGRRAGIAEDILESEGYPHVVNAGGLRDLTRQGVATSR